MFKIQVNYENFDGEVVQEELYFHMSVRDWMKADKDKESVGGYGKYLDSVLGKLPEDEKELGDLQNATKILGVFEDIVRRSYGVRSEDGRKFVKTEETTEDFMDSFAYDAFLDDLLCKEGLAEQFVNSLVSTMKKK